MNKYYVSIELCSICKQDLEENRIVCESPTFSSFEEADEWYRTLKFPYDGLGIDIIIIEEKENGEIENTWVI